MTDGYLSRDRAHLADLQRKRRLGVRRMDYMPGAEAVAIIEAHRATLAPGTVAATNSAVLDAIVCEWGRLTGTNYKRIEAAMSSANTAGIVSLGRVDANDFGAEAEFPPEFPRPSQARAGAYESDAELSGWWAAWLADNKAKQSRRRVPCGARRHRDGQPCKALSEPGKRRCRFHGGRSTGPRTPDGKARALANLRQFRKPDQPPVRPR